MASILKPWLMNVVPTSGAKISLTISGEQCPGKDGVIFGIERYAPNI